MEEEIALLESLQIHVNPGQMDELRVYDRALTAKEIAGNSKNGGSSFGDATEAGLTAGWHFNEGSGISCYDYRNREGGFHLLHLNTTRITARQMLMRTLRRRSITSAGLGTI